MKNSTLSTRFTAIMMIIVLAGCSAEEPSLRAERQDAEVPAAPADAPAVEAEPTKTEPLAKPGRTPGEAAFDAFMARQERDPRFAPLMEMCGSPPMGGLRFIADVQYERPGTFTADGGINFMLAVENDGEVLYDTFTIPLETIVIEDPNEPALAIRSTAENVTGGGSGFQSNGERFLHHSYENEPIDTQMPWCDRPADAVAFFEQVLPTLEDAPAATP